LCDKYRTWGLGAELGQKRWQTKVAEIEENQEILNSIAHYIECLSVDFLGKKIAIPLDTLDAKIAKMQCFQAQRQWKIGNCLFNEKNASILLQEFDN
jgi:hypothetical protein